MELISIKDIINDKWKFEIPVYQRGYRWTQKEVTRLIEDIKESKEPYFLQVLTVQEIGGTFRIIDGQQRLTTILLLLDKDLKDFFPGRNDDIINQYHIDNVKNITTDDDFKTNLKKAQFLLYKANDKNDNDIFQRLNSGKISLSSAEILKAKLITEINDEKKKRDFAKRWQDIECRLQDDDFFFYICPNRKSDRYQNTRMDYILELIYYKDHSCENLKIKYEQDPIFVFNELNAQYSKNNAEDLLDEIEGLVNTKLYKMIYSNTELYNAFGYYLYNKTASFPDIVIIDNDEDQIINDLYNIELGESSIEELDYDEKNKDLIYNILLQYNVRKHTEKNIRFDFKKFSLEDGYDIEHIYARNSKPLEITKAIEILKLIKQYEVTSDM